METIINECSFFFRVFVTFCRSTSATSALNIDCFRYALAYPCHLSTLKVNVCGTLPSSTLFFTSKRRNTLWLIVNRRLVIPEILDVNNSAIEIPNNERAKKDFCLILAKSYGGQGGRRKEVSILIQRGSNSIVMRANNETLRLFKTRVQTVKATIRETPRTIGCLCDTHFPHYPLLLKETFSNRNGRCSLEINEVLATSA